MDRIPPAMRDEVEKAIIKSAEEMAERMRHAVPVDSGDLRDSITVTGPGQTTPPFGDENETHTAGPLSAIISVGEVYGLPIEVGTEFTDAQPFFNPVTRLLGPRAKSRIGRAGNAGAKKAAGGGS